MVNRVDASDFGVGGAIPGGEREEVRTASGQIAVLEQIFSGRVITSVRPDKRRGMVLRFSDGSTVGGSPLDFASGPIGPRPSIAREALGGGLDALLDLTGGLGGVGGRSCSRAHDADDRSACDVRSARD